MSKNNQKKTEVRQPLTKQQLFVHPIALLQRQRLKNDYIPQKDLKQVIQKNEQIVEGKLIQNFSDSVLYIVGNIQNQQQTSPLGKLKRISKDFTKIKLSSQQSKVQNFRTKMCPDGKQCRRRLTCTFAHNQFQLRRPYKNRKSPCLRYQKGLCSLGSACPDYHGNIDLKKKNYKYKTQKCNEWQENGKCSKGQLCIYIHIQNSQIQAQNISQNQILIGKDNFLEEQQQQVQLLDFQRQQIESNIQKNKDQKPLSKKPKICDIFNTQKEGRKLVEFKQVIEQKIPQKPQIKQQNQQIEQCYNIEFNF